MGKGKQRHNPDKKQNNMGYWCDCCEEIGGHLTCEVGAPRHIVEEVCKGNPHNCCKVTYRKWAGKKESDLIPHSESEFKVTCEYL